MNKSPLLTFQQAKELILTTGNAFNYDQCKTVSLMESIDCYLAESIYSPLSIPSFNNSAMDGYVVRQQDIENFSTLPIAGSIFAGDNDEITWPKGSCLRIMTGAYVPQDAYAVIMQEKVTLQNNCITFDQQQIKKGQNIRYIGESINKGDKVLTKGERLTIGKLATLATLGIEQVKIYKPIKVALFSTGNELTSIGEDLKSNNHIYDSNRFTLHLMLKTLGCEVIDLGIIKDDLTLIKQTLQKASEEADLVITSGGVSVGDADYVKQALEQLGHINFWKIAIKPGKPFAFGHLGQSLFCGLPGNPVSSLVTFYQLVQPLILTMFSQKIAPNSLTFKVKTTSNLTKTPGRLDFQRGYLYSNKNGELVVTSTGQQGSHFTSSFDRANCFILLEKDRGDVLAGEWVIVEPFNKLLS